MSQDTESVLGVVEAYKSCILRKDAAALVSLYAEDVRVFDTWGAWSYEGAVAWRLALEEWFGSLGTDHVRVAFDDVHVFNGGAAATLSAVVKYTAVSSTGIAVRSMQNRLTWNLRDDRGWKIGHEHTSAPIGLSDLKAILRRE
jgi:ketosteroid isomerase-like protein